MVRHGTMQSILLDRPKISRARWEVVKMCIMKERERQKQEQEADAEEERRRRERERQRKESAMSIEETREELHRQEQRLAGLKEEKHQLFSQLKKVLNEEVTQRRLQTAKEISNEGQMMHTYLAGDGMQPMAQFSSHAAPMASPYLQQLPPPGVFKVENVAQPFKVENIASPPHGFKTENIPPPTHPLKVENLSQPSHPSSMPPYSAIPANLSIKRPPHSPSPPPAPARPPSNSQPPPQMVPQNLVGPGYGLPQPSQAKSTVRVTAPMPKQPLPPPQSQPYNFKTQPVAVSYAAPIKTENRSAFVPSGSPYYHPSSTVTIQSSSIVIPAVSAPNSIPPPRSTAAPVPSITQGVIYSYPPSASSPYDVSNGPPGGIPSRKPVYNNPQMQPTRAPAPAPRRASVTNPPPSSGSSGAPPPARSPYSSSPGPTALIMRPTATMPVVSHHQQSQPPPAGSTKNYGMRQSGQMPPCTVVSSSFQPQGMPARPIYAGPGQPQPRLHFPPPHPNAASSPRRPANATNPDAPGYNPWSWNYANHFNGVMMMMSQYNAMYQQQIQHQQPRQAAPRGRNRSRNQSSEGKNR